MILKTAAEDALAVPVKCGRNRISWLRFYQLVTELYFHLVVLRARKIPELR